MSGVRIDRMRLHRVRDELPDGYAAVRALDLGSSAPDHAVLVIRRLSVPAGDRRAARERIAALRESAARPALGPTAPGCAAVLFSDEVEALSCLTADIVAGRAADRWYWPTAIRTGSGPGAGGAGETLARLWLDRPHWVPAVLAQLARRSQADAVRAVGLLSGPQARVVLDAVLAAFRGPAVPAPPTAPAVAAGPQPSPAAAPDRTEPGAALRPEGRALLTVGLALAATPASAYGSLLGRAADGLPQSAATPPRPADAAARPTAPAITTAPDPAAPRRPTNSAAPGPTEAPAGTWWPADAALPPAGPAVDAPAGTRWPDGAGPPPVDPPSGIQRPDGAALPPVHSPAGTPADTPASVTGHAGTGATRQWHPLWGTATESRFASVFYAVNLMAWLELPRVDAPVAESGWATLEALGRSLLPVDRTAEQDPVWRVLAELDGRDPTVPSPVRLGALTHRLRDLLDRYRLTPDVFARPGTVFAGRTHIDVTLNLQQVDLAARMSGLDQDPGWVPALGRIIAFHFDDGS
ncbi:hypothetical protein [Streptomyces sp. NPDC002588]|uniref:hypothetical protein n=1 Tax=Streptomyces sp. NPDC002588 TaxID=3154419 RepID=UPI003329434B